MKEDIKYLKLAIEKSKESFLKGFFPAGAIIAKNGKIISSGISGIYPNYKHAELKAIDKAFNKSKNSLENYVLYSSLEPCLMCLTTAYWTGIRKIVFACNKQAVSSKYYENNDSNEITVGNFHKKINLIHFKDFQDDALEIIKSWENKSYRKNHLNLKT